jgi:hypothetical protein
MAHENVHPGTKEHHEYSREEGYKAAEYTAREYPKAITLADGSTREVQNAEEEARFAPKKWNRATE